MTVATVNGARKDMNEEPCAATQDTGIFCTQVLSLRIGGGIAVIAQTPFPYVPAHIHHAVRRCAIREDAHRAGLPDASSICVALLRVVLTFVRMDTPVRAARRLLPF